MRPHHSSTTFALAVALLVASLLPPLGAAELVKAASGSGVVGYKDTPVLPWCGFHVHDPDRPEPKRVDPGDLGTQARPAIPPADAIVLFDGKDLSQWQPTEYKVGDGYFEAVGDGQLTTKMSFGSMQLHLEWMAPDPPEGDPFNRGNNGVFLMGLYEIQIFDSYSEKLYPDGQAAAVYGQTPPLVNVTRKPGQWQTYDILFLAPKFDGDKLLEPARVTMLHNGVLVHLNQQIYGETGHRILPEYKTKTRRGPLVLGGHHNPVRFRNVWVRPL